jgi:hypothetical protein
MIGNVSGKRKGDDDMETENIDVPMAVPVEDMDEKLSFEAFRLSCGICMSVKVDTMFMQGDGV